MKLFKSISISLTLVLIANDSIAHSTKYISIEEAVTKKLISANFESTGDHSGFCINSKIMSNVHYPLVILVEAGIIFDSQNDYEQDILITKQSTLKVSPTAELTSKFYGFCCQSNNSSPSLGSKFHFGRMADSLLLSVAKFINSHHVDEDAQQATIWAFSNNRALESIPQSFNGSSDSLIAFCSKLKNKPPPSYFFGYKKVIGQMISEIKETFNTKIEYKKKTNGRLQVAVFDAKGNIIKTLVDNNFAGPDLLTFNFKISLQSWKKGVYVIKFIENNETSSEKTFDI